MAAIVKSVQKESITLGVGTTSSSAALSGQTTANCIPFRTIRVTTPGALGFDLAAYAVDVYFSGTNVVAERASGTDSALVVEVSVVEFDTTVSNTRVEQGTFTIPSANPTVTIDSRNGNGNLDLSKAFPCVTWIAPNTDAWGEARVFAEWQPADTTGVTLDIDRVTTGVGDVTGHWYVVQSDEFSVQAEQMFVPNGGTSDSNTLGTTVTLAETFVIGGYKTNTNFLNQRGTGKVDLTTTSVTTSTNNTSDYFQGTMYIVSMGSTCGNVQHISIDNQASTASESVNITAVTQADSIVLPTGLNLSGGAFTGSANPDVADAFCAWDFVDQDTVRVQHNTSGGETGQDLTAQVIEWELTAAPRRVMVIS